MTPPAQSTRHVRLRVDLASSNCGAGWYSVDMTLEVPTDWTDEKIRHGAAEHYDVPLGQVGRVRWAHEAVTR